MSMRRVSTALLGVLAALTIGVSSAQAATIALNFDNTTGQTLANPPFTLGWSFVVNDDIVVTDLGFFDDSQNGLAESHEIGLWDSSQNLLVSTTLPGGTAATLDDKFRFTSVGSTLLLTGQTYFIGAVFESGNDPVIFPGFSVNRVTAPEITYAQSQFQFGGSLAFPPFTGGPDGYFGPNFRFNAVPEPMTILLFGTGVASVVARRRRISRS